MGTRSRIGIVHPETGTVTSIYCHWDGYLSHVGSMLLEHYSSKDRIRGLMTLGDLSSLNEKLGEKHDFDSMDHRDWCTAYGRDRGETGIEAKTSENLIKFFDDLQEEYTYVFMQGKWHVMNHATGEWTLLTKALVAKDSFFDEEG